MIVAKIILRRILKQLSFLIAKKKNENETNEKIQEFAYSIYASLYFVDNFKNCDNVLADMIRKKLALKVNGYPKDGKNCCSECLIY